jgi:hypothetical protein
MQSNNGNESEMGVMAPGGQNMSVGGGGGTVDKNTY